MSDVPFHLTRTGARFYEHTLPELVRQLERLNQNLERLADLHEQGGFQPDPQAKEIDRGQDLRSQNP